MPIYSSLTNDLTEQVKVIFCSWFEMYSVEDEEHGRVMNPDTCVTFFEACAAGKNNLAIGPRDNNIRTMFDKFESFKDKML